MKFEDLMERDNLHYTHIVDKYFAEFALGITGVEYFHIRPILIKLINMINSSSCKGWCPDPVSVGHNSVLAFPQVSFEVSGDHRGKTG